MTIANDLTGESDSVLAFAKIYNSPELMKSWIESFETLRDRLERSYHCRAVAVAPQGRFGLESVPCSVVEALKCLIERYESEALPLAEHVKSERKRGMQWDEIWGGLPEGLSELGFGHGDSRLLRRIAVIS